MSTKTRKKRRVTLKDVAELAGVSLQTVSNVIRKNNKFVGEETRKRVEEAVQKLGYRPHSSARGLRISEERCIGFLVVDDAPQFLSDPFITELVAGVSNFLSENNYSLEIQGMPSGEFEKASIFDRIRTDALCVLLCGTDKVRMRHLRYLEKQQQPVIIFQEYLKSDIDDSLVLRQDDYRAGRTLGTYLLEKGARRFVFVVPRLFWPAIHERLRGVKDVISPFGEDCSVDIVSTSSEIFQEAQDVLSDYLDTHKKPDVVMGSTDRIAIAALKQCEQRRWRVPQDVWVTGFNGFESSQYSSPVLTTVTSPAYEMGQQAGSEILHRLKSGEFSRSEIVFPVRFQPGESA